MNVLGPSGEYKIIPTGEIVLAVTSILRLWVLVSLWLRYEFLAKPTTLMSALLSQNGLSQLTLHKH